jgi:hypothetical protein
MCHSACLFGVDDDECSGSNTRRLAGQIRRDYDQGATLPERFGKTRERGTQPKGCYGLVESHAPGLPGSQDDIYRLSHEIREPPSWSDLGLLCRQCHPRAVLFDVNIRVSLARSSFPRLHERVQPMHDRCVARKIDGLLGRIHRKRLLLKSREFLGAME